MYKFRLTEKQHLELKFHLHNGDGLEAIAFGLCGRLNKDNDNYLFLHKLFLLPNEKCERAVNYISWNPEDIEHLIEEAHNNQLAIVKFHSHPVGNYGFSELDDESDKRFFESVYAWLGSKLPHASFIMYQDGNYKARIINDELEFKELDSITIIGQNLLKHNYTTGKISDAYSLSMDRNKQAFGLKTVEMLGHLKVGVVGCSGTGSPTIEQLVRLGVGELVLVDPDKGELVNINRIMGLNMEDARLKKNKVDCIKEHINRIGLETMVKTFPYLIQENQDTIEELASCDIIFGCVDSAEGRYYLNLICHYYLVPIIDIGVKLSSDGNGGIDSINGNIHYVYPGSFSLLERKVINSTQLEEEELNRISPEEHRNRQVYFDNTNVPSPAVISVNMLHSSLGVLEMLARLHPYRYNDNSKYCVTRINITDWDIYSEPVDETESRLFSENTLGIGDKQPLIRIYDKKTS